MAIKRPIEAAEDWLQTAEAALKAEKYDQSLYSLEMAVEIAFKAVLNSVHVEVPKIHDIRKSIRVFLAGNKKMPEDFLSQLDDYLAIFESLLRMRSAVGYGFETSMDDKQLANEAKALLPKCSKIISSCRGAINKVEKSGTRQ